jgi:hypothetical protein
VKLIMQQAVGGLHGALRFASVHAAALQPGRLAAWLEGAAKLPAEEYDLLVRLFPLLLDHQRPPLEGSAAQEAPGLVTAAQWERGATQLRREVCVALVLLLCGTLALFL